MDNNYKTVLNKVECVTFEKKSKFIANICPISKEEEAQDFLTTIRKKYKDASHNCFAYIVNNQVEIARISDDGEPSGTAGSPILMVISKENIKNTIIVVTRYFGGTLLGTGGLIKAYTNSAKDVIDKSTIIEKKRYSSYSILTDYSLCDKLKYVCNISNYYIEEIIYTEKLEFKILVEEIVENDFIDKIINISNNSAKINKLETLFCCIEI
jgi:uncharacterized YigZ family protein